MVVTPTELVLEVGSSEQLTAAVYDVSGNQLVGAPVSFESENVLIAGVSSDGLVVARAHGTTKVTARSGAALANVPVVVVQVAGQIEVTPDSITTRVGDTISLAVIVIDVDGDTIRNPDVPFDSSDETVAIVDATGSVTGIGAGTGEITVQCDTISTAVPVTGC